jgi:hypothetical protein
VVTSPELAATVAAALSRNCLTALPAPVFQPGSKVNAQLPQPPSNP